MSQSNSFENHRCSGVISQKSSKGVKKKAMISTTIASDDPNDHTYNCCNNSLTSTERGNQVELESIVVGYQDDGSMNGEANTEAGCDKEIKDVRKKRRSQSDTSDGSPRSKNLQESDVGFMWTQANGYHSITEFDTTQLSPDVFYASAQNAGKSTDDMNGYVNANAHMLAYLELNGDTVAVSDADSVDPRIPENINGFVPNGNEDRDIEDELQSDKVDEGIALAAELEFIPPATTKLSTSSEDQGDFIETDISVQQMGFSSYASSQGSSCNDLPNLVQASNFGEHHNHNNNVTKDNQITEETHHQHYKCESCERNQHLNATGTFNFNSSQSNDCYKYSKSHGTGIKPKLQTPPTGSNPIGAFQSNGKSEAHTVLEMQETLHSMWHNISQPVPQQRHASTTNRSSTSSFYSPDMDIEFMDLDFEPSLVNSDLQQEFQPSETTVWSHANDVSTPGNQPGSSLQNGADNDRFSDNDDNIDDNCFCYGCDKISDKFSNHSSHFKSSSGAKTNPLISCCRHGNFHTYRQSNDGDQISSSLIRNNPECKNCDEHIINREKTEPRNIVSDERDNAEVAEGAVGFTNTTSGQSHSVPNNLDMVGSSQDWNVLPSGSSDAAHYNVLRQTSTSNFDQDENKFQDYFEVESNLNRLDGDSFPELGKQHYFSRPKEPLLQGLSVSRLSCGDRQHIVGGEDENEADDEQEEEDEGTPPPIPNPRPPLNRRLELLEAHNQNLEQNLLPFTGPSSSVNSENQVLDGAVGGPDFRPGATNFGDDELPSRALHLLEYQFQSDNMDFNSRRFIRQVPRPSWLSTDNESPLRALRFLEHELSTRGTPSCGTSRQMCGEDGYSDISPTVGGLHHLAAMDSLTDMFVANLLRKKPQSRCGRLLVTEECEDGSMEKVMIWSEYEAYVLQVKQIGVSACGATAVINVLKAFDIYPDKTAVCKAVKTNLRAEMSSVPEYLLSRSVAGTTAHHLIDGIDELTSGDIYGRFFHFWPPREIELKKWLAVWMKKGAVPVVTLNLQKGVPPEVQIPDAWHHQMVYGVGPKGIYLTNPLDVVSESAIYEQLTSDSVLLVRRSDIILRWTNSANLGILINHSDSRWRTMNVTGQVVNAMRESNRPRIPGFRPQQTSHVLIPAFYKAGVTLFVKKDSKAYNELLETPDVPLKNNHTPKYATHVKETKPTNHLPPRHPPAPGTSRCSDPPDSATHKINAPSEPQS